jgi:hypothetical protein
VFVAALGVSARHELLFAANRDERHARPSEPAHWWPDAPDVLGGRDLRARGTWLAVDRSGRLAAVTNFRDGSAPAPLSRGALVADYLSGAQPLDEFAAALAARRNDYGPFSLLLREHGALRIVSNRAPPAELGAGVHAISNAAYGVEWPKVRSAREGMRRALEMPDPVAELFAPPRSRAAQPRGEIHDLTCRRPGYGTRSTVIATPDGHLTLRSACWTRATITNEVRLVRSPLARRSTAELQPQPIAAIWRVTACCMDRLATDGVALSPEDPAMPRLRDRDHRIVLAMRHEDWQRVFAATSAREAPRAADRSATPARRRAPTRSNVRDRAALRKPARRLSAATRRPAAHEPRSRPRRANLNCFAGAKDDRTTRASRGRCSVTAGPECGEAHGTPKPELRHDRLEIVAVGTEPVQQITVSREPRGAISFVQQSAVHRTTQKKRGLRFAHMPYYMRNFIHRPFPHA